MQKTKPTKNKKTFLKPLRSTAISALSLLAIFAIAKAGNITPPTGAPTAQFYSLSEIYQFITNNTTATQGGHSFDFSDALSSTHHTLTEIYDALAGLISANKVKLGTTYLAVAGTLTPDGGTATAGDLFNAKTSHLTNDWDLDTGTLNLACNTATFDGTQNLVADAYDGNDIGNNRWCTTDTGDAVAGEILSGKKAWIDGIKITGSLATQTLSADSETVAAGNYLATTLSTIDSDLSTTNIKSGINLFGIDGNSNVVNTSSGDATASDILATKIGWIDGQAITGTMANIGQQPITPTTTNTAITQGYHDGTGYCAGDADLLSANIKSEINLFGIDGNSNVVNTSTGDAIAADLFNGKLAWVDGSQITGTLNLACNDPALFNGTDNLVATAYDGAGDGSNRWCMTDSGTVAASEMKTGQIAWVDGQAVTGTGTQTLLATSETVSAGYYESTTLSTIDSDLAAANILSGKTIFGINGSVNAGYTYGDEDQSKVLTTATGAGTYDASNLSVSNVRYGQSFGVSSTGTMSSYPNTPSDISGLNQTACSNASWTWVADSNHDGVNDDPICVQPARDAVGTKVWNTSVTWDNTFIGNYSCSDSGDNLETFDAQLDGKVVENAGYGDDADTALAITDCKDGIRNLLSKAEVESFGYTAPDTDCTPDADSCYNGPLTSKALLEWKGTKLPSHNDFFGVCGNGTTSETHGDNGVQIGRTDNVITANAGSDEWLSERCAYNEAQKAGVYACSYFGEMLVIASYGFRAIFRP